MPDDQRCKTCRCYDNGRCRRYPPQPVVVDGVVRPEVIVPRVAYDDWCGEWRAKDEQPEIKT